MYMLYEEIVAARRDWDNAQRHFEYALGRDQVDYAIFAIEAAEKRYEMLLRKAKALQLKWPQWYKGEVQ
ncbi:YaaL family protein [Paenibacillus oenotherae]|uniref:YaaL family protein n=2 Tax=Paenibacillus oenotherae TaxID=1435645 RepID=A0ABS7DCT7_9BACL|nr:YaaL family protein [Paenibacillus oenotherae]